MMKDPDKYKELYRIDSLEKQEKNVKATVLLNPSHEVFSGHFPGNPILPGVFIIQILKDIMEEAAGKELMLSRADSIKYLSFVIPETNTRILFDTIVNDLNENIIRFSCNAGSGTTVFCRVKGEFQAL